MPPRAVISVIELSRAGYRPLLEAVEQNRGALETTLRQHLGETARLTLSAEGATLTLSGVSGQALAQWLTQARIEARTLPTEARLNRQANGLWEGQMTLLLPAPASAR